MGPLKIWDFCIQNIIQIFPKILVLLPLARPYSQNYFCKDPLITWCNVNQKSEIIENALKIGSSKIQDMI